jgi:branched-chain amino acid transport system ATP-binding protein
MAPLLELRDVTARYGPIQALHGVSLTVEKGEIAAVLGANGAGKTTTLRAVSGSVRRDGELWFAGERLSRLGPDAVARLGVAHVPEGRGTFSELTVWENLRLGAYTRRASKDDFARIQTFFPWLEERRSQQAGTLSGGEQQMLALARAFMQRPRLLLLDEPSLGLAPRVVDLVFEVLSSIRERGLAVLLVEQRAQRTVALADRSHVLANGELRLTLGPESADDTEALVSAYLA